MTVVALLHGGMHWGWSWDLVRECLEAAGFRVVTPDLPVEDDEAGAEAWASTAIDAINSVVGTSDPDVVVVAHSIAGLCLPVVAGRRRIRRMAFLSALVPLPGRSFVDSLAEHPDILPFVATVNEVGEAIGFSWESIRDAFYHDCPEALARKAFRTLRRQSITVFVEQCPLTQWPEVPASSIVMTRDRVVDPAWSRGMARDLHGGSLIELDGGHSPFFANPRALCDVLTDLAGA